MSQSTASRRAASQPGLQDLTLQHQAAPGRGSPKPGEGKHQDADQGMSQTRASHRQGRSGAGAGPQPRAPRATVSARRCPARGPALCGTGCSQPQFPLRRRVACTQPGLGGLAAVFSLKPETPFPPRKRGQSTGGQSPGHEPVSVLRGTLRENSAPVAVTMSLIQWTRTRPGSSQTRIPSHKTIPAMGRPKDPHAKACPGPGRPLARAGANGASAGRGPPACCPPCMHSRLGGRRSLDKERL